MLVGLKGLSDSSTKFSMESNISWPFAATELLLSRHTLSSFLIEPYSTEVLHSVSLGVFVGQDDEEEWKNNHLHHSTEIPDEPADRPATTDITHQIMERLSAIQIFETIVHNRSSYMTTNSSIDEDDDDDMMRAEWMLIPTNNLPSFLEEASAVNEVQDSEGRVFVEALVRMLSYGQTVMSVPFDHQNASQVNGISGITKSLLLQPIFHELDSEISPSTVPGMSTKNPIVGYWKIDLDWWSILIESLRKVEDNDDDESFDVVSGALLVVDTSTCDGPSMTFELNVTSSFFEATFLGYDVDHQYDMDLHSKRDSLESRTLKIASAGCTYSFGIHPSEKFLLASGTETGDVLVDVGMVLALITLALMGSLGITLWANDWYVRKREAALQKSAKRSMTVVHSLFPETVLDQILEEGLVSSSSQRRLSIPRKSSKRKSGANTNVGETTTIYNKTSDDGSSCTLSPQPLSSSATATKSSSPTTSHKTADTQLTVESAISSPLSSPNSKPIADFFPSATVLFADLVGFTAWASIREPSQVFALLEAIFDSFDKIGKRKNVFKVEVRVHQCVLAVLTAEPNTF